MKNKTMYKTRNDFNKFTKALAEKASKKPVRVKLRSGTSMKIVYDADNGDEDNDEKSFHTEDWNRVWSNDGSSLTSYDYDIIGFKCKKKTRSVSDKSYKQEQEIRREADKVLSRTVRINHFEVSKIVVEDLIAKRNASSSNILIISLDKVLRGYYLTEDEFQEHVIQGKEID